MDTYAQISVKITKEERERLISGELEALYVQFEEDFNITDDKGNVVAKLILTSITKSGNVEASEKMKKKFPGTPWRDSAKIYKLHFRKGKGQIPILL